MISTDAMAPTGVQAPDAAREWFLSGASTPAPPVRRTILASWERCRVDGVRPEGLRVPFVHAPDLETALHRSAAGVLTALAEQLAGEPISIVLTDHTGLVLDRRGTGDAITRRLDAVHLAPGFSYAEEFAGTNGIGTALSSGRAVLVGGREHYADELGELICAGSPIRHPTRGTVVGLVDLTAWRQVSGALLASLAAATAKQVEHELLRRTGQREIALFAAYLRACQQSQGLVLALNDDVVITSDPLRRLLDGPEREALTGYALDSLSSGGHATMQTVELPSGRSAHLRRIPTEDGTGSTAGVFQVRLGHGATLAGPGGRRAGGSQTPPRLPGVVGSGAVWAHCVQQVQSCHDTGGWVALEGEPGTGRRALLRAVHKQRCPTGRVRIMQPPEPEDTEEWLLAVTEELTAPETLLVLADADRLGADLAATVGDLLVAALAEGEDCARVALTLAPGAQSPLRAVVARAVEVPALRHHVDDLGELVTHLLGQLPDGDRLTCSPQALDQLSRVGWPGNVAQLRRVLVHVHHHRRSGLIVLADLPPECHSTSRRILSPLEAMERDAIVTALGRGGTSPTSAARMLGVSRATIYRRIRSYSIIVPSG